MNKEQKRKIKKIILYVTGVELIRLLLSGMVNSYLKFKKILVLYSLGYGIGDQVCMTSLPKLLNSQFKVIVISDYPEIFDGNPYVYKNIKLTNRVKKITNTTLNILKGSRVLRFHSKKSIEQVCSNPEYKNISLIELLAIDFSKKLNLDLKEAAPNIYFTSDEIVNYKDKYSELPEEYAIIMPNAKLSYTPNKRWDFNKFQEVVDSIKSVTWIQTGSIDEQLLLNLLDFRGKTSNIKELAYLVSKAKFIVATEGLLNHLSAAFNIKSFVIFTGFNHIGVAHYSNSYPVFNEPQVNCAPCYLTTPCPKDFSCSNKLTAKKVFTLIENKIK